MFFFYTFDALLGEVYTKLKICQKGICFTWEHFWLKYYWIIFWCFHNPSSSDTDFRIFNGGTGQSGGGGLGL